MIILYFQFSISQIEFSTFSQANAMQFGKRHLRIEAETLYEAGFQYGRLQKERIERMLERPEIVHILNFIATSRGQIFFKALKRDNGGAFPYLVREMEGISAGSKIQMDKIWALNLMMEIEAIAANKTANVDGYEVEQIDHCTDVYAHDSEGFVIEGHNEDYDITILEDWAVIEYIPVGENPNFSYCSGMAYSGLMPGWGPTWNKHGMYHTQNTLNADSNRADGGFGTLFVQRDAICGGDGAKSLDDYLERLLPADITNGASLNVVDLKHNQMANIELWESEYNVLRVNHGSYNHRNKYTRMFLQGANGEKREIDSTRKDDFRTTRLAWYEEHHPPTTVNDIRTMLGDPTVGPGGNAGLADRPVYYDWNLLGGPHQNVACWIINGKNKELLMWDDLNPSLNEPSYRFQVL